VRYGEGPPVLRVVLRYRHGWERVLRGGILLVIMAEQKIFNYLCFRLLLAEESVWIEPKTAVLKIGDE
jgi:hypothetical protein